MLTSTLSASNFEGLLSVCLWGESGCSGKIILPVLREADGLEQKGDRRFQVHGITHIPWRAAMLNSVA